MNDPHDNSTVTPEESKSHELMVDALMALRNGTDNEAVGWVVLRIEKTDDGVVILVAQDSKGPRVALAADALRNVADDLERRQSGHDGPAKVH